MCRRNVISKKHINTYKYTDLMQTTITLNQLQDNSIVLDSRTLMCKQVRDSTSM